jgi:hypothetical protein
MAITIPVTHAAKQKNSRRSPKSTGMFTHPSLRCAGATLTFQEIAFYWYPTAAPAAVPVPRRAAGHTIRTRSPSLRATMRKPSCLISCSHSGPEGGCWALVGRHGAIKPSGRGLVPLNRSRGVRRQHSRQLRLCRAPAETRANDAASTAARLLHKRQELVEVLKHQRDVFLELKGLCGLLPRVTTSTASPRFAPWRQGTARCPPR